MGAQQDLEKQMDELLVKKAPFQIPEGGRKAIVQYLPIISLIFGIISILAALGLWNAARDTAELIDGLNRLGIGTVYEYGFLYYTALVSLIVQGVIMLIAFKPLQQKLKKGWDLVLLGVVLSFLFGLLYLFTDSGHVSNFIGSIIGTLIGLYILAQIKGQYKNSVSEKSK